MILSIQLSFIFSLSCYCTYCLYARALSFSYTLITSLLMTLNLHVQYWICFISVIKCSMSPCMLRGVWSFSLFDSGILPPFYSCFCIFLVLVYQIRSLFMFFIYMIHVWMLICDIAVSVDSL